MSLKYRNEIKEKIKTIDLLLQAGSFSEGGRLFKRLIQRKIPREYILQVSELARRNHQFHLAVQWLNPIVRSVNSKNAPASHEEKAEYAASLSFLGAADEALSILNGINADDYPQVYLFKAFALIAQWEYESSIALLKKYIGHSKINEYQRLVGNANLAAALVHEKKIEANGLIQKLIHISQEKKFSYIYGYSLSLASEYYIGNADFDNAKSTILKAKEVFSDSKGLNLLFMQKWEAIVNYSENKSKEHLSKIHDIRNKAVGLHWETVRDCERFIAIATQNKDLLLRLYFGTPYESFKTRLLNDFGRNIKIPKEYLWSMCSDEKSENILNLCEGRIEKTNRLLKTNGLLHRMLQSLCSDLYSPLRIAEAHRYLFPNEYYNPITSPKKVHEAMRRLKEWFKKENLPLEINEKNSFYSLKATASYTIKLNNERIIAQQKEAVLEKLKSKWPKTEFSIAQAVEHLKTPRRSTQRLLQNYVEDGVIRRVGTGMHTHYLFI